MFVYQDQRSPFEPDINAQIEAAYKATPRKDNFSVIRLQQEWKINLQDMSARKGNTVYKYIFY